MRKKISYLNSFIFFIFYTQAFAASLTGNFTMADCARSTQTIEELEKENKEIRKRGQETARLYVLAPNETLKDITQKLYKNPNTSDAVKESIQSGKRKFYIFSYKSDGLTIKGYLSLPQDTSQPLPLMILLRGGSGIFGLPHPRELSIQPGYALISTTYRGGVSEGEDEYGGEDVNDVKNLIEYLPQLAKQLNITFHRENKYMIGVSRGGMQLFLALGRFPELQQKIKKVASISGLLDLSLAIEDREDYKAFLTETFGYTADEKGKAWVAQRQPLNYVSKLSKTLPILIAQGTEDTRVCLKEGYNFLEALHAHGHEVTYVEIEGGDHVLVNSPDFTPILMEWLAQ